MYSSLYFVMHISLRLNTRRKIPQILASRTVLTPIEDSMGRIYIFKGLAECPAVVSWGRFVKEADRKRVLPPLCPRLTAALRPGEGLHPRAGRGTIKPLLAPQNPRFDGAAENSLTVPSGTYKG
jgi:hypothetical protein